MVSAVLHDALSDPTSVIISLQSTQASSSSIQELPLRVAHHFEHIFKDDDAFKQIPTLDSFHTPACYQKKAHSLVRFRAMVQDTSFSPEVYLSLLQNGQPGGWGLSEITATNGTLVPLELQHMKEREVVWAVNVPGESPFVAEHLDDLDLPSSTVGVMVNEFQHKDPLMRERHVGVQVKLYDPSASSLKPTELYTFIGLLTFEHLSSAQDDRFEGSQVPTLHTLFSVEHPSTILSFKFPLQDGNISSSLVDEPSDLPLSTVRNQLIQWIADEALGGDRDAAELVLLITVARVQSRQPALLPLSLTLSRFPKSETDTTTSQTPALAHVLRCLLPLFVEVPLSLPLINSRPFSPESHDESLHSGLLQLPAGTTILFSDSGVTEGKITEAGVKNIQTLRSTLMTQTVDYHFPFSSAYQFPTDLTFIFLTEGKESPFAKTQVNMPLECKRPSDLFRRAEDIRLPPPKSLDAFRRLLGGAKIGDVRVTEEISEHIQADFVRERQDDKTTTAEDLMTRMAIARLLALSLHDTELTIVAWQKAKDLDQKWKRRTLNDAVS